VTIRRWRHLVPFPTRKPIDVACSGGEPSETGGSMRQFHVSKAFLTAFFPTHECCNHGVTTEDTCQTSALVSSCSRACAQS
jgi:hypothetical protein